MKRRLRVLPTSAGELCGWAALAAAAWGRSALGFRWQGSVIDGVLIAALATLLGIRIVRLLPRLRRRLGRHLDGRPAAVFFWLPLAVYLALLPWTSAQRAPDGDEPYYLLITHSLAYDLDTDLADEYADGEARRLVGRELEPQAGDPVGRDGEVHSRHGAALPMLLAPAYRVAGRHGALAVMAALAAALAWAFLRAARHDYGAAPRAALLGWAAMAFAPPLLVYAHQVWVEVPAALLLLLAWDATRALERDPRPTWKRWLAIVLPLAALPLLKLRFIAIAVPLLALAAARSGRRARRTLLWAGVALAAVLALVVALNLTRYGHPLRYDQVRLSTYLTGPAPYLRGLLGLGFDSAFGLLPAAPVWAASIAGVVAWSRRRARPLVDALVMFVPYLLAVSARGEWYGAWSPPFRYALVTLPFVGLALVEALSAPRTRGARAAGAALVAATLALAVLWIVIPGWTYNLADGTTHLIDALSVRFDADLGRFAPSLVRPRLASWCVPALTLVLVPLLWRTDFGLGRRRRRSGWVADLGVAVAILALPAWLLAARLVPTRIVEFEDAQVRADGGALHPPRWTPGRSRFRGGWTLGSGQTIRAPVVAGGRRLAVRLAWRPACAGARLELGAAGAPPDRLRVPAASQGWSTVRLGPLDWPAGPSGRELVVSVAGQPRAADCSVLLDRAVLIWDPPRAASRQRTDEEDSSPPAPP